MPNAKNSTTKPLSPEEAARIAAVKSDMRKTLLKYIVIKTVVVVGIGVIAGIAKKAIEVDIPTEG
jgi:predicted PurR-regulated permease PerM